MNTTLDTGTENRANEVNATNRIWQTSCSLAKECEITEVCTSNMVCENANVKMMLDVEAKTNFPVRCHFVSNKQYLQAKGM